MNALVLDAKCGICKKPLTLTVKPGAEMDGYLMCKDMFDRMIARGAFCHNKCRDSADNRVFREQVMAEKRETETQWAGICPKEFLNPIDFTKPRAKKANWDHVRQWSPVRGIYVHGEAGLCKTRFVYKRLGTLFMDGKSIACFHHGKFRQEIVAAMQDDTKRFHAIMNACLKSDILFIDDIGSGRFTPAAQEAFETILNYRTENNKPIVFTSVESPERLKLSEDRNDSIVRRIMQHCDIVHFTK